MVRFLCTALMTAHLAASAGIGSASEVGKVWPGEQETWIDAEFGHEITRWTDHDAPSWHLYFNIESFIDNDHAILFSERTGTPNLFKLNFNNGEMIQMTDEADIDGDVWHWPQYQTLWYVAGRSIKTLHTETLESRTVRTLERPPRSFTVTSDGKWIVFAEDAGIGRRDDDLSNRSGPFAIYRMDARTGEGLKQISPGYGFIIGHLQASPTDPTRISYCWQHLYSPGPRPGVMGMTPIRIWWIDVDGTDGGPLVPQELGIHRTHEFWFPDGSRIGYSARYQFGPKKGEQFLGSCRPDGSDQYMFPAPVSHAHSMMYEDQKHWVVDLYDGPILMLLTMNNRTIQNEKPLFRHDSSWNGQASHPHPHFSPDGRRVLFSTDRTGSAQVYSIKIRME